MSPPFLLRFPLYIPFLPSPPFLAVYCTHSLQYIMYAHFLPILSWRKSQLQTVCTAVRVARCDPPSFWRAEGKRKRVPHLPPTSSNGNSPISPSSVGHICSSDLKLGQNLLFSPFSPVGVMCLLLRKGREGGTQIEKGRIKREVGRRGGGLNNGGVDPQNLLSFLRRT